MGPARLSQLHKVAGSLGAGPKKAEEEEKARVTGAMSVGFTEARERAQAVQATGYVEKDGEFPQYPKGSDKEGSAAPRAFNYVLCLEDADFVGLSVSALLRPFPRVQVVVRRPC
ncbi:hypothetical protein NDU88_003253 [Pleurodeles waltl]|uniref:Uncharacterized protein n=1 Tax=Pleurodeles waltl TaxID=8319 RepID=A0AAV7KVZ3_PLEWA|nr:hypothetical protein NDU88_003253 [Pleurodeles waltl]